MGYEIERVRCDLYSYTTPLSKALTCHWLWTCLRTGPKRL